MPAKIANMDMLCEFISRNNDALEILKKKHKVDIRQYPDEVLKELYNISKIVVKELSLKDVSSFLSDQASINIDKLYDLVLIGNIKKAYKILVQLQNEGISAIQILRAFTRQLQNLYNIKERVLLKKDINFVLDNFKPPIYFKRKDNIKLQTKEWTFPMIKQALKMIEDAEINCKSLKSSPEIIIKHTILNIGMLRANENINF